MNETVSRQACRKLIGLTYPTFVERHVGALQNPCRVAVGLAMAHQQDRHGAVLAAIVRTGEFRITLVASYDARLWAVPTDGHAMD